MAFQRQDRAAPIGQKVASPRSRGIAFSPEPGDQPGLVVMLSPTGARLVARHSVAPLATRLGFAVG